jgi:hypothetical protein
LLAGADEHLVDGHPAVAGHDVGHRVGDVFRPQRLDRLDLAPAAAPIPLLEPVIRATVPVSGVVMVDDARGNGRTRSRVMDFRLEVVVLPVSDVDEAAGEGAGK